PRARGAPHGEGGAVPGSRITPACAGSTGSESAEQSESVDHPRVRGEHPSSSPRGTRPPRITPACAGSTRRAPPRSPPTPDHPRVRGEHVVGTSFATIAMGSPPRARGAHLMTRDYSSPPRKTDSLCAAVQALRLRR